MIFRMIIVGGTKWTLPFGASAVMEEQPFGEDPSDNPDYFPANCYYPGVLNQLFLDKGRDLGKQVATVAMQMTLYDPQ